eukprot:TRINITY_DN1004_c0_g1_i1.p2 TRINITY_DN1004_c0_g1~~TRINITY_DN1004_c0_g1_i1.p2  ORF type:complete len:134 (-),score=15.59 TRINITY_DN1004_c0_g1_i1:93-494(-)
MLYTRIVFVALSLFLATLSAKSGNDTESPYLIKKNAATQLVVNGKPFLMLGGELGNSSASSLDDISRIFPKLEKMGLNTVLVPACWELIEKEEGKYDYSIIDGAIDQARKNNLKIIFLWFGSWKNSMPCYAPM